MAATSKTACIARFLKEDSDNPPKVREIMELKKSVSTEEWSEFYTQLPKEYQTAE